MSPRGDAAAWRALSAEIKKAVDKNSASAAKTFFVGTAWSDLAVDIITNGIDFESSPAAFARVLPGGGELDTTPDGIFFGPLPAVETDSAEDRARRLWLVARSSAARYFTSARAFQAWRELLSPAARLHAKQPDSFPAVMFLDPEIVQVPGDALVVFDTDALTWAVGRAPNAPFPLAVVRWLRAFAKGTAGRLQSTVWYLTSALRTRAVGVGSGQANSLYCEVVADCLDDTHTTTALGVRIFGAQMTARANAGYGGPSVAKPMSTSTPKLATTANAAASSTKAKSGGSAKHWGRLPHRRTRRKSPVSTAGARMPASGRRSGRTSPSTNPTSRAPAFSASRRTRNSTASRSRSRLPRRISPPWTPRATGARNARVRFLAVAR